MSLSGLRAEALERDGGCKWPHCDSTDTLEMAHLTHRGMGGNPAVNVINNVVMLCRFHHDILDGRTVAYRRRAVTDLMQAYLRASGVVA